MFGMSAPSVSIAEQSQDIRCVWDSEMERNQPQFTRTGYSPVLKPSTKVLRSAAGVLECTYLASTPASRNDCVSSLTWERLTQNTRVDLRSPERQESKTCLSNLRSSCTGFVEPSLHDQGVQRLSVDDVRQAGWVIIPSDRVDRNPLEVNICLNAGKSHVA